jgi:glycine dehydrogenase subunit 2
LLRAYAYIRLLGKEGLHRVAEFATLNANYLMVQLKKAGFTLAFPTRRASHEFIITLTPELKAYGVNAMDVAKRLLDYGFHAPTTYFPLLIPECLLIEPTETESKEALDGFIAAMAQILNEARTNSDIIRSAPQTLPIKRLDEVKAARELNIVWSHHDE